MIRWNLAPHMKRKGWENAHQLTRAAKKRGVKLNMQTAYNVLASTGPLQRIDVATLQALATLFGVKKPWALLEWTEGD